MSEKIEPIDFGKIIEKMAEADANTITASRIAILGGRIELQAVDESVFEDDELTPGTTQSAVKKINLFLEKWKPILGSDARVVWETMDSIEMLPVVGLPSADENFVRARLFGKKGDLTLRRDGDYLYWHLIGELNANIPRDINTCDFWTQHESASGADPLSLRCEPDVEALLWGKRVLPVNGTVEDAFWRENRVGKVDLVYPVKITNPNEQDQRVKIKYDIYWHDGKPAFYWLKDMVVESDKEKES